MINQFVKIQNVGPYRDLVSQGDVSLSKLNLIFAENARGKTTLCAILRSLQSGNPSILLERKSVGVQDLPAVKILIEDNSHEFHNNAWNTSHSHIAVFDADFVQSNIHSGDIIDQDNKRSLHRLVVGKEGVVLAKQVDILAQKIKEANEKIKKLESQIPRPSTIELKEFFDWEPLVDIDQKIEKKSKEIEQIRARLRKASDIKNKSLLSTISLPLFPYEQLKKILETQIDDLLGTAVNSHFANHHMESWICQGLNYIQNEQCPFCAQGIKNNNLIEAFKAYFKKDYLDLKSEIVELKKKIDNSIGPESLRDLKLLFSQQEVLIEFWKQMIELPSLSFPIEEARNRYKVLHELATNLLEKKQNNLLEKISFESDFFSAYKNIEIFLKDYNDVVNSYNQFINHLKTKSDIEINTTVLEQELLILKARKQRFEPEVIQTIIDLKAALKEKEGLETEKTNAKKDLDNYSVAIFQQFESSINRYLDRLNTGFRIVKIKQDYIGGSPRTHFQLALENTTINIGSAKHHEPNFKTVLSAGDKSALALAFFLASLVKDSELEHKIVVLDDPFTSLDHFRRSSIQQIIGKMALKVRQIIVLSHDPHFLKQIKDNNDAKTLQIFQMGKKSFIGEWDIVNHTLSTYLNHFKILNERNDDKATRSFITELLRVRFPKHFKEDEELRDFISKIKRGEEGLHFTSEDVSELESINNYHHESSREGLQTFVKRTLRFIGIGT